jgi:hypothetical protein
MKSEGENRAGSFESAEAMYKRISEAAQRVPSPAEQAQINLEKTAQQMLDQLRQIPKTYKPVQPAKMK